MADVSTWNETVLATVSKNEYSFRAYFTWRRFETPGLWAVFLGFVATSGVRKCEKV